MLKLGKDLGLSVIKTQHKEGNDKIKDLHYKINDILYQYNRQYITGDMAETVLNDLTDLAVELKGVGADNKSSLKIEDILTQLRGICKTLKEYHRNFKWEDGDRETVQKIVNYCVAEYVREKAELDDEGIMKFLRKQRSVIGNYINQFRFDLNLKSFESMNTELFRYLDDKYRIRG